MSRQLYAISDQTPQTVALYWGPDPEMGIGTARMFCPGDIAATEPTEAEMNRWHSWLQSNERPEAPDENLFVLANSLPE